MRLIRPSRWSTLALLWIATLGAGGSETRLVEAVKNADRVTVGELLQRHADVNATEVDGTTALHWAVRLDDQETARLLIAAGANVKAANRFGVVPLSLACTNGSAGMIELLLKAGANPNTASLEGQTALMTAARTGKVDALKMLLAHGADVNATERWKAQTALMWAAGENHAAAVQTLIELGADIHARSNAGFTPLLFAVRDGQIDAVRVLLAAGANVNDAAPEGGKTRVGGLALYETAGDGETSALVLAIINGHFELASLLLDMGADPNVADPRGSALHALAWIRRPGSGTPPLPTGSLDSIELAKALLTHGANPDTRIAWTEIKFNRGLGVVKSPPSISVGRNYISFNGATPFYLAAKHGDIALMRLLVANGADPVMPTQQKVTPLMAAAGLGFWDGESPGPETGVPEGERLEAVKLAWELDQDVNAVADFGETTPLKDDGLKLLMAYPVDLENFSAVALAGDIRWTGSTAMHGAAVTGLNSIVQFLADNGARLDARNTLGWTPLMVAEGYFAGNTAKDWPATVALLRELMKQRGLDPALNSQHGGVTPSNNSKVQYPASSPVR